MTGRVVLDISVSLDGFITGPDDELHRIDKGMPGREPGRCAELADDTFVTAGAVVMGPRTSDLAGAENRWAADPPFRVPVFVAACDVPDRVAESAAPSVTFVTDGIDSAVEQARAAAGAKNVIVLGAITGKRCLWAGHVDQLEIHLVPVLLGEGIRLFGAGIEHVELVLVRITASGGVTHLRLRTVKHPRAASGASAFSCPQARTRTPTHGMLACRALTPRGSARRGHAV
jgi:dihydrofolate reductase